MYCLIIVTTFSRLFIITTNVNILCKNMYYTAGLLGYTLYFMFYTMRYETVLGSQENVEGHWIYYLYLWSIILL